MHVSWNSLAKASASPTLFMGLKGAFLLLMAALSLPFLGLSAVPGPAFLLLENGIAYVVYLGVLAVSRPPGARQLVQREWSSALWAAVFTMASYSLILYVMQTEPLSYVVAVRQCSVVLSVLYGWLVLRESQGPTRLLLSVVIAFGVTLIACLG